MRGRLTLPLRSDHGRQRSVSPHLVCCSRVGACRQERAEGLEAASVRSYEERSAANLRRRVGGHI